MEVKLIAMDLDGTTLQPDHLTMSQRLIKDLRLAYDRGIQIVPVTGRPYRLLPEFLKNHPAWESCAILCNGAQIRDMRENRVLQHLPVSGENLHKILDVTEKYSLCPEFNADGRLYLTGTTLQKELLEPGLSFHCEVLIPKNGVTVDSLREYCHLTVEKVHLNCIPDSLMGIVWAELEDMGLSVVCEKLPNLEVTSRNATKGKGLKTLCSLLGIPLQNVLALGDSGNDLSLMETAGFSVAMGSAPDFLRQAADAVTGTNLEDGAAAAIETYVL